ncbi:TRAP-type C4-dicarboxylate transport system permease large subunit [Evansella vedderi]|uniref:TRAP-type C4-dicarboxylate transport system permease large subunit n=1 Tax=Evansella vedderi TaxID=38282 RepID=A0ABT9ZWH2_9BACI|nr:hypothetical protein [Evansella vedderi]MDQ0254843.1 TRAP-type C4-dicarboxylate transport system permease large subunit [Evansella vedderi]
MGYSGFFALLILMFLVYFWFRVDELKKGTGMSTKEAVRKGVKSMLTLILSFCFVLLLFIAFTYYQIL